MKLLTFFMTSFLVGLAGAAPTSKKKDINADDGPFSQGDIVYTGQHDIVNILLPINGLMSQANSYSSESRVTLFFVEADIKENGERVDQGLYILKNGHTTKLLDHGRDIAADSDTSITNTAYFAAKDGLYSYNAENNKAEKYGTVTNDLISIAKVNHSDVIYALTKDNVLYKVTEEGTKKEKVDSVVNAKQIVLDYQNNLFYSTTDNKVFGLVGDKVKKFEGLPENPGSITILRPPVMLENGVPIVIDNDLFMVYSNGTIVTGITKTSQYKIEEKPTAYSMEGGLLVYYAYKKKIYEFNLFAIILDDIFSKLRKSKFNLI